jgi:hypothetical protein
MKKMSKGLLVAFMVAVIAMFLSSCTSTGTGKASVAGAKKVKGKLYENTSPELTIRYPSSWKAGKKRAEDYLYVVTGQYALPNMRVYSSSIKAGTTPEEAGKTIIAGLEKSFKATKCKVLYAKEITLADGTRAIETEVQWKHPDVMLYSCTLQAIKGDVAVTASITDMYKVRESNKEYLRTLLIK